MPPHAADGSHRTVLSAANQLTIRAKVVKGGPADNVAAMAVACNDLCAMQAASAALRA